MRVRSFPLQGFNSFANGTRTLPSMAGLVGLHWQVTAMRLMMMLMGTS